MIMIEAASKRSIFQKASESEAKETTERGERERERQRPSSPPWVRRELRDNGGLAGARLYLLPREDLERAERPRSHERPSR